MRETFFKQFCAGSNKAEVQSCIANLQCTGYDGVILEYAREVLADTEIFDQEADVKAWLDGTLQCVDLATKGGFVGLKWSGMGMSALQLLRDQKPPSKAMADAMTRVCDAAAAKGIRLLPAAEETTTLDGFHNWCIGLQRRYNHGPLFVIYTTYQTYLKSTAGHLANHMADAQKHGYTLGAKFVRGAYLGSEPGHLVWRTKERTDAEYDGLTAAVLRGSYNQYLKPAKGNMSRDMPRMNVVLATHNAASVQKAQSIQLEQAKKGQPRVELAYAQLQGMADEVSCALISRGRDHDLKSSGTVEDVPKVYKLTTWGTMTECLGYLLRRATENKEAAGRTYESRLAMGTEVRRRMKNALGLV